MSLSNPLSLPLITDAQNAKHVTHNDAILKLSQALGNSFDIDVSADNVAVALDTAQRNKFFQITGAATAGREVTLPLANRSYIVRAVSGNAEDVELDIDGGSAPITFPPASTALVITKDDGFISAFFLASTASVSNFTDLADVPGNYSGSANFVVAVNGGADGLIFIDPDTLAGGVENLNDLEDVDAASLDDGYILQWNETAEEWQPVPMPSGGGGSGGVTVIEKTATHTLELSDASALILMNASTAIDLIVPANSGVAFPVGSQVSVVRQGSGAVAIVEDGGVTVNSPETLELRKQYSAVTLTKIAADTWHVIGDLAEDA